MRTAMQVRLVKIGGLVLTLPIAFLLFAVSISLDAGPVVGTLVVVGPLTLFGAGLLLLLRGLAGHETDAATGPA